MISEASFQSLLLGKSTWTISNDRECSSGKDLQVNVSFSTCQSKQFACNSGHCIDLEARCDGTTTCADGSDEIDCRTVQQTSRYNKNIVPPNIIVFFQLKIYEVLNIDVSNGRVHIMFEVMLDWFDPRLIFINLKTESVNRMSQEEYESVWRPLLIYKNMEPSLSPLVEEPGIMVHCMEESTLSGIEQADRAVTFSGAKNSLQWSVTMR